MVVERDGLGKEGELIQVHAVHKAELFHLQSHLSVLLMVEVSCVAAAAALLVYF